MPVPISSGWLKFSPSLNLNKIEHFSKVSVQGSKFPGEIGIKVIVGSVFSQIETRVYLKL